MAKERFKISKFQTPNGQEVYRVSGMLRGKRIRENHASRDEAAEARQKLEIRFLNEREEGGFEGLEQPARASQYVLPILSAGKIRRRNPVYEIPKYKGEATPKRSPRSR